MKGEELSIKYLLLRVLLLLEVVSKVFFLVADLEVLDADGEGYGDKENFIFLSSNIF